ncbi:MAG: HAD family hydrolase [Clostridium sp.]|nr:HAD family hydrolase [Clostridium sp.]
MSILFWDFDGTLVCSNPLWSNSVYSAIKEVDYKTKITFNEIRKCMASGFTWHTPDNDYSNIIGDKWWDFMTDKICKDYINLGTDENIAKKAAAIVRPIIKKIENYTLYSDTISVLENAVKSGHKNVLLSNNYPDLIDVVSGLGLSECFDRFVVSAQVGYDKPRIEIFDIAKSFYPNEQYIMIGDSVSADIIGGNNAGMTTVLVHKGFNSNADFCFDSLSDINIF